MNEMYDGFGPHGPANADVTQGVDYADLYAHAPDCNCYSCSGQAGEDAAEAAAYKDEA